MNDETTKEINIGNKISLSGDALCVIFLRNK